MTKRILHVVSNVAHFADPSQPTGLWLSELTHAHDVFAAKGYEQRIVSPKGGLSPLEPRALKWPLLDGSAKRWLDEKTRSAQLAATARPEEIDPAGYDAIYFTGGHAVMFDFPDADGLQRITRAIYERGGRSMNAEVLSRPSATATAGFSTRGSRTAACWSKASGSRVSPGAKKYSPAGRAATARDPEAAACGSRRG